MIGEILVTRQIPAPAMKILSDAPVELIQWDYPDKAMPRDKLLSAVQGCDACLCMLTDKINAEFFDAAGPQLKTVATMSVGFDHIDVAECKKRGILTGYTPGVLHHTVAELTVALLLATTRRLSPAIDSVRNNGRGTWEPLGFCGRDWSGGGQENAWIRMQDHLHRYPPQGGLGERLPDGVRLHGGPAEES